MPTTVKDEQGVEHQVHTQEEIDAIAEEKSVAAVKEVTTAAETAQADLTKIHEEALEAKAKEVTGIQSELETAKEALEKEDQGTKDWASARQATKDLTTRLEEAEKGRDEDKKQFAEDIRTARTSVFQGQVTDILDGLAGDDKELREKVQLKFNSLGGDKADDLDAAKGFIKDAFMLVTGKQAPNALSVARGSNVGGAPIITEPASQDVADLGGKFGVTTEDVEKFGAIAAEKKAQQANQGNE